MGVVFSGAMRILRASHLLLGYRIKRMQAFQIHLNGKKLCVAGVGERGVLSGMVTCVAGSPSKSLSLNIGGLISPKNENVSWIREKSLQVGDKVQVKIVDVESVDEPSLRYRIDPARDLRARKNHVLSMAKEFGWKIDKKIRDSSPHARKKR